MNSLFRKRIEIFVREIGKTLLGYLIISLFCIWLMTDFIFDSFKDVIAFVSMGFILLLVGISQGYKEYKIQFRIYECREIGRNAGRIGRPPNFYDKLNIELDVADKFAIMQGWDIGNEEFNALSDLEKSILYERNQKDGF